MRTSTRFALLVVVVLALTQAGCSKTIQIGAVISETGAVKSYGEEVRQGLDLAVEEINAAGGFGGKSLELIYIDDGTNPEVGRQVVEQLISEHNTRIIIFRDLIHASRQQPLDLSIQSPVDGLYQGRNVDHVLQPYPFIPAVGCSMFPVECWKFFTVLSVFREEQAMIHCVVCHRTACS